MTKIAADQARNDFDALIDRAAAGEEIVITDGGKPVARLLPAETGENLRLPMSLEELKEWRKGNRLGPDLTIRELVEEGRKH